MVKKFKLPSALSSDYSVIGIATQLRDFRLCHFLNEALNIKLVRKDDIPVSAQKEDAFIYFPFYRFFDPHYKTNWYLISNKNHLHQIMLAELKQLDYFFINDGLPSFLNLSDFTSTIKKIGNVQIAQEIALTKSKSLNHLLEDLEMHILELDRKK